MSGNNFQKRQRRQLRRRMRPAIGTAEQVEKWRALTADRSPPLAERVAAECERLQSVRLLFRRLSAQGRGIPPWAEMVAEAVERTRDALPEVAMPTLPTVVDYNSAQGVIDALLGALPSPPPAAPPPSPPAAPPPAPAGDAESRRVAAVLEGGAHEKVLAIARGEGTVDERMARICAADRTCLGWTSVRWARLLTTTDAAVRQTRWWRVDRPRLRG
jgi:hypothetical protein